MKSIVSASQMQDRIIPIIWVLILSLFLIYWDPKGQPWRMQVFLLNLIFFGGTLATWAKGSRSLIKLLVTYVACHFVVYAFHPASPMLAGMDLRTGIILKMRSSLALVSFLACYSFSVGVAHDIKLQLLKGFGLFAVFNSILMLFWKQGILNNQAMDASFVATAMPLMLIGLWQYFSEDIHKFLLTAIGGLSTTSAIIFSHSSTGLFLLGIFSVMMTVYMAITTRAIKLKFAMPFSAITLGGFVWAYSRLGDQALNFNGRDQIWKLSMDFWAKKTEWIVFGTGMGTFETFGPHIQMVNNWNVRSLFIWLHNDWLQILFELGAVGFVGAVLIFVLGLYRLFKARHYALLMTWILFALSMLTQMPWRQPITAIMGTILILYVFDEEFS